MKQSTNSRARPPDAAAAALCLAQTAAAHRHHVEGRLATHTWADTHSYRAAAYMVVPRQPGGWRYTVSADGFNDSAYYGRALTLQFTAREAQPWSADQRSAARVRERGEAFWVWLSSISGPAGAQSEAVPYFEARFAGMRVSVEIEMDRRRTPG